VSVETVVLRAAVGDENFPAIEQIAALLDALGARGVISNEGLGVILGAIAAEITAQRVISEFGLLDVLRSNDTSAPEDPAE
jgi:hypothetical protein